MTRHTSSAPRQALGIIYLWFGALKFVPGLSPAEDLVAASVSWIIEPALFLPLLAIWECAIGVGFLTGVFPRLTRALFFAHLPGTLLPCVFCPEAVWTHAPFGLTLEGQYIVKNLASVGLVLLLAARELHDPRSLSTPDDSNSCSSRRLLHTEPSPDPIEVEPHDRTAIRLRRARPRHFGHHCR